LANLVQLSEYRAFENLYSHFENLGTIEFPKGEDYMEYVKDLLNVIDHYVRTGYLRKRTAFRLAPAHVVKHWKDESQVYSEASFKELL
jgi:hypothetical protein